MAREYQNGDGFGYHLAFRRKDTHPWMAAHVPHVDWSRYVYFNDSLTPYTPFEVKIKAYNRKGEGPFSQIAVVHSAEEGESLRAAAVVSVTTRGQPPLGLTAGLFSWLSTEPTAGPLSINATVLTASEIRVSWDPVQQLSANGILRGYEVGPARPTETHHTTLIDFVVNVILPFILIIIIILTIALFGILRTALSFYSMLFY